MGFSCTARLHHRSSKLEPKMLCYDKTSECCDYTIAICKSDHQTLDG